MTPIARLLAEKRVLVCCGAGGVGKTTVSASLALAAARAGRRVLVVTIDPSRRLAEALGVARNPPEPVPLSAERLTTVGIKAPGSLAVWMLDPQRVSDRVVRAASKTPEDAERLMNNRIYANVTAMIAGMQEYTAVEALHRFVKTDAYDLVILDTPPSRNALRFLEAPDRINAFLDGRIFSLFVPGKGNMIRRMATNLIERVMDLGFGPETRAELQQFFTLFHGVLAQLNHNQTEIRQFFQQGNVGFLLVTSPARAAVEEAFYFEQKTRDELKLPLAGYLLNRSLACEVGRTMPRAELGRIDVERSALTKLIPFAQVEQAKIKAHATLARELAERAGSDGLAWVLPRLPDGANDLEALDLLARAMVDGES